MKDPLNQKNIQTACKGIPVSIFYMPVCASTNASAKEWVLAGGNGAALFVAGAQSEGRGRLGRRFYSPDGSGVYLTLALANTSLRSVAGVTCAAAVAVLHAIQKACGVTCQIKWVNDLLYRGKKVCGILAERITKGGESATLIGVGVNLRPAEFPPELKEIAGSLENETTTRAHLIAAITEELLQVLSTGAWLEDYRKHSCVLGKPVVLLQNGRKIKALALAVEKDGGLRVKTENGEEILHSGEITLRLTDAE